MSLQSDLITALALVAGGRVFPRVAEQGAALPLVNYKRLDHDPAQRLNGASGLINSTVLFECWGRTYAEAIDIADQVRAAIDASALTSYETASSGEDTDPETEFFVEPVTYGFWHT